MFLKKMSRLKYANCSVLPGGVPDKVAFRILDFCEKPRGGILVYESTHTHRRRPSSSSAFEAIWAQAQELGVSGDF